MTETQEKNKVEGLPSGYSINLSLEEQARINSIFGQRIESMLNNGDYVTALYTLDNVEGAGDLSALYAATTIGLETKLLKFEDEYKRSEPKNQADYNRLLELAKQAVNYCRQRAGKYFTKP